MYFLIKVHMVSRNNILEVLQIVETSQINNDLK